MNRVIITGPTGAIGMALTEYLSERNVQVIAVVRGDSARKSQMRESDNVAIVECALTEMAELPQRVREAIRLKCWSENHPIEAFYHLAWDGTFGDSRNDMYLQNRNVKYALNAVDAAAELGCEVFIGAGSQAEYGRYEGKLNAEVPTFPENGYGIAKLCAGQMTRIRCEQKGIRHIWTRILSVYGPYDGSRTMVMSMIDKMLKGERASCTKGEQMWDYLYSKDAANMMYLLGCHGVHGKIYCLGSGMVKPLREYIEAIRDIINPDAEIGFGDIEYSPMQVMNLCADISELQQDTGFEVRYSFQNGIMETIEWVRGK
ncbi:MAG: NAD(P)-dependent oxidoreductase [Lachnospiraceae bacterium]|nr:NAD(P)-dependent oxidoreductase [Lachnospiraceae bacterium]